VDLPAIAGRIDDAAHGLRAELDGRLVAAETLVTRNRQEVVDQQRRIGLMLNALRDRVPEALDSEDDHTLDSLYLEFEDRFRGTRSDIKQRQAVYLARLRDAGIGSPERPVLDIGAGRGEFLELMRDEGLVARGVDLNVRMAALCREAGLDCTEADALTYLAAQPSGSLGAVTGFHVVEHLPFKLMVRIMDEALRVLMPGGLIIFETPNPANILTASRNFYLDPTHRNPLPGEMMAMVAEARGFADAEIVELHPMTARFPGTDRALTGALDRIFHGPQDYALIARRR
jgi:SAM-dependent methyltransferase